MWITYLANLPSAPFMPHNLFFFQKADVVCWCIHTPFFFYSMTYLSREDQQLPPSSHYAYHPQPHLMDSLAAPSTGPLSLLMWPSTQPSGRSQGGVFCPSNLEDCQPPLLWSFREQVGLSCSFLMRLTIAGLWSMISFFRKSCPSVLLSLSLFLSIAWSSLQM